MTGTETRLSERAAGDGRGVIRARKNGAPRRAGTPIPRLVGLLSADKRPVRAFFVLIGAVAGGTISTGSRKGKSKIVILAMS